MILSSWLLFIKSSAFWLHVKVSEEDVSDLNNVKRGHKMINNKNNNDNNIWNNKSKTNTEYLKYVTLRKLFLKWCSQQA